MFKTIPFLILMILITQINTVYAQGCCGAGSSLVAGGHPTLEQGTILLQTGGDYAYSLNPLRHQMSSSINLAYGITNRFALSVKTSYVWKYSSINQQAIVYNGSVLLPDTTLVFKNHALGDALIGAQFSIIPITLLNKQELTIGIEAGIPWGSAHSASAHAEIPKSVQIGNGSYSLGGFLLYNKSFPMYKLAGSTSAAGRVKFANHLNENPGDEASFLVSGIAGPFWKIYSSVSLNYKVMTATISSSGVEEIASSGSRVDVMPALECAFNEHIKVTCGAEFPLWRDTNQKKYGNVFGARAGMQFYIPVFN